MLFFSRDLGIDLGTSNVLIYAAGRGIVLREPSVIALDKNSGKVLQVGAAARSMLGRTPGNVPLQDGVISDYELTARMLTEMLRRVLRHAIVKPRMIVTVPSGITEVEERAVIQAAMEAGARRVYLIEAPLAAALGAQLDITAPEGRMVVDIDGYRRADHERHCAVRLAQGGGRGLRRGHHPPSAPPLRSAHRYDRCRGDQDVHRLRHAPSGGTDHDRQGP